MVGPVRNDGPYALDVGRKSTLSKQFLAYCSPNEKVLLGEESDTEQNVNKHMLAESAAYFGLQMVIKA